MKFLIKHRDIILITLVLAILLCFIYRDVVFSNNIFIKRDISRLYLPVRAFVVDSIKSGEMPLWNPSILCGTPVHGAIHHAVFYPLTLIYYIGNFPKGFSYFILLHILLCGVFTYIFAKSIGLSKLGSALSGFAFAFSGYIISTICLTTVLSSVTWFPLAMFFFCNTVRYRKYTYSLALGIVYALMFIAGDPPVFIVTFLIFFVVYLYLFIKKYILDRKADFFIIKSFLVTSLTFFLLTAFQTMPALEFYLQSGRVSISPDEAFSWSFPISHMISFIIPHFNEPALFAVELLGGQKWLDSYYIGIITIALALIGAWVYRKKRVIRFLIFLAIFSLMISFGKHFFLLPILYKLVHILRAIRYPVRFLFIFTFSSCILAGVGFDWLKQNILSSNFKKRAQVFLVVGFLLALSTVLINIFSRQLINFIMSTIGKTLYFDDSFAYAYLFNLRKSFLYLGIFGLFIFLCSRTKRKYIIALAIFILIGSDILMTNVGNELREDIDYYYKPTENINYVLKDEDLFRVCASPYAVKNFSYVIGGAFHEAVRTSKDLFIDNRMMEFGISTVSGYESGTLKRTRDISRLIYGSKNPSDTNLLSLLNVKYISSHNNVSAYGYKKVNKVDKSTVYLNTRHLPRAMLLREPIIMDGPANTLNYISTTRFDPKKEIVFEEDVDISFLNSKTKSSIRRDKVDIIKYNPREIVIDVSAKSPAFLRLSDTYYPGWIAYINNEKTKILRSDYILRALKVPTGEHRVKFIYRPLSFYIGSIVTILSLLLFVIYSILWAFKIDPRLFFKYNH